MSVKDFLLVSYGYETLYGFSGGGITRLSKKIAEFDFYAVLQTCLKINLTLYAGGYTDQPTQIKLIKEIFQSDLDIRKRIVGTVKRNRIPRWTIFTEQQNLLLLKIALQFAPRDTGKSIITPQDVCKAGHWLLIATDMFLERGANRSIIVPVEQRREDVREFLVTQFFFKHNERLAYRMVRFENIFSLIRKLHPEFSIDEKFSKATNGVSLENYISFCFFLLVNWVNKTTKPVDVTKEWLVSKKNYFKETALKPKEIDDILSLLLLDIDNFDNNYKKNVKTLLKENDIYPYNFLLMRQRPLIAFNEECFTCPSPDFLMEKATEGVYWIVENYLKEKGEKKEWDLLPSVWGDAFEVYINTRFEAGFGKRNYFKNFSVNGQEKADGILKGKNIIGFIETKYAHWTYKAKLTGKKDDMRSTLSQLFFSSKKKVKGLGQITRSIKELENGDWNLPFDRKDRKILPIIVVGEAMPMDAYNRKMYEDIAKETNVFYENNSVLPFIILSAYEVEMIEAVATDNGNDAAESLLIQYSELFKKRNADGYVKESLGFHEFIFNMNYEIPNNKRLLKLFDKTSFRAQFKGFPESKNKKLNK